MDIQKMHVWFRQYAQQMGLQNVRAILPEQIDLLINTSISDVLNQTIAQNIGVTNDRVITDNSKIGQINALKTLYKVKQLNIFKYGKSNILGQTVDGVEDTMLKYLVLDFDVEDSDFNITKYRFSTSCYPSSDADIDTSETISINTVKDNIQNWINSCIDRVFSTDKPSIDVSTVNRHHTSDPDDELNGYIEGMLVDISNFDVPFRLGFSTKEKDLYEPSTVTPTKARFVLTSDNVYKACLSSDNVVSSYLFLVDFAIDYKSSNKGFTISDDFDIDDIKNGFVSTYFPVRLIDDAYLADTLNDFILSPKLRSPILTIYGDRFDLYFGDFVKKDDRYFLENNLIPYRLRVSYIAKPAVVKYASDLGAGNVDCDLPEYLHVDILKHAVDLYRASISGSLLAAQSQDNAQQREVARQQAVPSDGYRQ